LQKGFVTAQEFHCTAAHASLVVING